MARSIYSSKYTNSWAVVIGINQYQHASPLNYACNDATAFADLLISKFGFPTTNVTKLLNQDATLQNIQEAVHGLVPKASEDDRVVIFYAGHGHTVPAYGREAGFLVPVEGRADNTSTLLPWDDLSSTSRMIPAKHMFFIMDACYGGLIGTRALVPGSKRFLRDMLGRYARQFLTAGKADEVVADGGGPRNGHSIFTGHLLDALEGGLHAPDGLVSANAIMAHVYDRVSKDAHARQSPHYGFLTGDGDFFFAVPVVESDPDASMPTSDILVEVPPDLLPQVHEQEGMKVRPSLPDQVKEYLSEPKHRIRLHDLAMRELRAAQQQIGEEHFSTQGGDLSPAGISARLLKYEAAISNVLSISILCGCWAEAHQQDIIRKIIDVLDGQNEAKGGNVCLLALRSYPMLLLMYAAGIAAIESDNYVSLKTILGTNVQDRYSRKTMTVVEVTNREIEEAANCNAFKILPGHEQHRSPMSEFLYKRIQPVVEDALFIGPRYEQLFDRFEVFYALANVHYQDGHWGHPGRFAWKYYSGRSNNPFKEIVEEASREGANWAPLRAGLFNGSHERFAEIAERFRVELLNKLKWY